MKRGNNVTKPPNLKIRDVTSCVKGYFFCIVTAVMDTMTDKINRQSPLDPIIQVD